jgi:hypothetical protein
MLFLFKSRKPVLILCLLLGKRVLLKGGLQWAPFFQDRREFYQTVGPDSVLPTLFAIIFTEISVFLFEDAILLNIWIFSDSFDKSDIFDRMNAWATLLSVTMCIIMFLASLILWLRLWIWKDDLCSRVCQVLSAISFLAGFGVIIVFLLFLVFYGFRTIASDDQSDQSRGGFIVVVCVCWMFASFFACTLRQRARVPQLVGPAPAEVLTIVCDQQDDTLSTMDLERSIDDRQDGNDLVVEQDYVPFCFAVSVIADEEVITGEVSV